jgi:hypothetical protein
MTAEDRWAASRYCDTRGTSQGPRQEGIYLTQESIYWQIPPGGGNISRCHLGGKNNEKGKRKRGKMQDEKEERGKKKEKMRKKKRK